jgi:phosphonate metabolism protein (transferase hexapeptide repeat family)
MRFPAEILMESKSAPNIHPTAVVTASTIGIYTDIGPNWTLLESTLGDYSYLAGSDGVVNYTEIGKFCSIASHVAINPGNHPMHRVTQHHCTYRRRRYGFSPTDDDEIIQWRRENSCRIDHDVWIGTGAKVMAGVHVKTGAVVAAGAVVTKDVDPYHMVAGVPALFRRTRFDADTVTKLLRIAWWEWDRRTLEQRFDHFRDLASFLEHYG